MPNVIGNQGAGAAAAAASIAAAAGAVPPTTGDVETVTSPTLSTSVARRYNTILRDFMSFTFSTEPYPDGQYPDNELLKVQPEHIIRYFKMKLYGNADAEPTTGPISGSHHTLDYHKKAISSFMPQKDQPWNDVSKVGNPTKAKSVKNFAKLVRLLEKEHGSSKKRKEGDTAATTPILASSAKKPRAAELPPALPAVPLATTNPTAIITSILQKVEVQNSLTIDVLQTIGTSLERFKNQLQENNQVITAEIGRLNNSLQQQADNNVPVALFPPPAAAPAPATTASPVAAAAATAPGVASQPEPSQVATSWFYDHPDGSTRRVPPTWKFPSGTLLELYQLWHLGDPQNCISPMKTFVHSDVSFCGKRSRMSLSEARILMNALDKEVGKAGRSITPSTSPTELLDLFRMAVNGLNMPLATPTGRQRDIYRLKWSTFTKYKITSKDEVGSETNDGIDLTIDPEPIEEGGSNWLYEHGDGSRRKVPSTWKFPMVGLEEMYVQWNCSDEKEKIMPLKTFTASDVNFLEKGSKNLAEVRGMMNIISATAAAKGYQIKEVMTVDEAKAAFAAGVEGLKIPLYTPNGKARNIARTKWSSCSRYKKTPIVAENTML